MLMIGAAQDVQMRLNHHRRKVVLIGTAVGVAVACGGLLLHGKRKNTTATENAAPASEEPRVLYVGNGENGFADKKSMHRLLLDSDEYKLFSGLDEQPLETRRVPFTFAPLLIFEIDDTGKVLTAFRAYQIRGGFGFQRIAVRVELQTIHALENLVEAPFPMRFHIPNDSDAGAVSFKRKLYGMLSKVNGLGNALDE